MPISRRLNQKANNSENSYVEDLEDGELLGVYESKGGEEASPQLGGVLSLPRSPSNITSRHCYTAPTIRGELTTGKEKVGDPQSPREYKDYPDAIEIESDREPPPSAIHFHHDGDAIIYFEINVNPRDEVIMFLSKKDEIFEDLMKVLDCDENSRKMCKDDYKWHKMV
ncbi:hypothetical protein CVT24_010880 [Panaeolus cyanescens]|uniref:Uncharacterized protein n=1 Tax=Panaeolus cyanescens TaxID=181874 RepID=A0A409WDB3_9AGAR|nr:hypothetical protein CVT24_010880 [Panaeolus cyanescens]